MPNNIAMGNRIAEARKYSETTVLDTARHMCVTEKTVRRWEAGKSKPRANKMQTLAGIFGVPLIWLLEGNTDYAPGDKPDNLDALGHKVERLAVLQRQLESLRSEVANDVQKLQKTRSAG